jgi:hypothetical protein
MSDNFSTTAGPPLSTRWVATPRSAISSSVSSVLVNGSPVFRGSVIGNGSMLVVERRRVIDQLSGQAVFYAKYPFRLEVDVMVDYRGVQGIKFGYQSDAQHYFLRWSTFGSYTCPLKSFTYVMELVVRWNNIDTVISSTTLGFDIGVWYNIAIEVWAAGAAGSSAGQRPYFHVFVDGVVVMLTYHNVANTIRPVEWGDVVLVAGTSNVNAMNATWRNFNEYVFHYPQNNIPTVRFFQWPTQPFFCSSFRLITFSFRSLFCYCRELQVSHMWHPARFVLAPQSPLILFAWASSFGPLMLVIFPPIMPCTIEELRLPSTYPLPCMIASRTRLLRLPALWFVVFCA